jgi:hypothetical protein
MMRKIAIDAENGQRLLLKFKVLTAVKMSNKVFWVVMPRSLAGGCRCFRGT